MTKYDTNKLNEAIESILYFAKLNEAEGRRAMRLFCDIPRQIKNNGHHNEKCDHPGCENHRTHPCEKCGNISGREL